MDTQPVEKIIRSIAGKVQQLLPVDRFYALFYDADRAIIHIVEPAASSYTRALDPGLLPDGLLHSDTTKSYPHNGMTLSEHLVHEGLSYWPDGELPMAWLGAPMVFENRTIGALVVENHRKPDAFGQTGPTMLTTIARQTAVAIERARLDTRRERTIVLQRAVHTVGQELSEAVKLGEKAIFELIDEQASAVMDTKNMYIALYDPATDMVSFPLMRINGQPQEVTPRSGGQGRTEWIIEHKKPILIRTKEESEAWYKQPGRGEYIDNTLASWVGVPMIYEDQVLGVIAAYHETEDYVYDNDDLEVLKTMAAETAVALENARLFEQEQQKSAQLEMLQDIGVKITSTTNLEEVLDAIVHHAKEIMEADFCVLFPYNREKHQFESGILIPDIMVELNIPSSNGFTASIAEEQVPCFAKDAKNEPSREPKLPSGKEIHSFACVPLVVRQNTVGVLYINYFAPHHFSDEEKEIVQLLCNQAAVALENARLLTDLKKAQTEIADRERILIMTTMSADFVHKINNLAGTIPNWVVLARRKLLRLDTCCHDNDVFRYLEQISNDVKVLIQEAQELQDVKLEPAVVSIENLLGSIVGQMELVAPPGVSFTISILLDKGLVLASKDLLAVAFFNLLNNAVKSLIGRGGEGNISIRVDEDPNRHEFLLVAISDNGVGIPQERLNTIFEMGTSYWDDNQPGSGYGLWRSKNIVESIKGHIYVKSAHGTGATFYVSLPIHHLEEV
jgi:GAF domain-containing protein